MKLRIFKLLIWVTAVAFWLSLYYFGVPYWGILLIAPVFGYLQVYTSNRFSYRNSLQLEAIPDVGYEDRISKLDASQLRLEDLGFEKIDEFYMRTASDIVLYTYKFKGVPVTLVDYDLQAVRFMDLETRFDNGYSLTTTSAPNFGVVPLLNYQLVQALSENEPSKLLAAHLDNLEFLRNEGFCCSRLQSENFPAYFLEEFLEQGKRNRSPLAPAKIVYGMAVKKGLNYRQSIRRQIDSGIITLPNH